MVIAGVEIDCAVLADETRLISDRGVSKAMGTKRGGSHWKRLKEDGALTLPPYLSAKNLQEFIPNDLKYILTHPVRYRAKKSGAIANGLLATAFPKVLRIWRNLWPTSFRLMPTGLRFVILPPLARFQNMTHNFHHERYTCNNLVAVAYYQRNGARPRRNRF